ncbi:unnamed protein product [Calypogeia fissa]
MGWRTELREWAWKEWIGGELKRWAGGVELRGSGCGMEAWGQNGWNRQGQKQRAVINQEGLAAVSIQEAISRRPGRSEEIWRYEIGS